MGWLLLALIGPVLVGGIVVELRRRKTRRLGAEAPADVESVQAKRPDTALAELRAMRDALGPAMHSRIERRRSPGSNAPKIERRRKGTHRAS